LEGPTELNHTKRLRHLPDRHLQKTRNGQELDVILAIGGALPGELVVFPQKCRQLQRLQMIRKQDLRGVSHSAASDVSAI